MLLIHVIEHEEEWVEIILIYQGQVFSVQYLIFRTVISNANQQLLQPLFINRGICNPVSKNMWQF